MNTFERPVLATVWDIMPGIFGKKRHTLSLADNDDDVVLMIEARSTYMQWHVSPPGYDETDYREGTVSVADYADHAAALEESKRLCFAAFNQWCEEYEIAEPPVPCAHLEVDFQTVEKFKRDISVHVTCRTCGASGSAVLESGDFLFDNEDYTPKQS